MKHSNCCGALMSSPFDDIEMCPECHEHCGFQEDEEEDKLAFNEMAMDAMIDLGLEEDEAEAMLEDFNY